MTNEAPRLRTLPVALAIMKAEDPMTAMNITSLRTLAKTNKISTIKFDLYVDIFYFCE